MLVKRKKELQQQADGLSIEDAEQKLSETLRQADEIEAKIVKTTERSRILLKQIYQVSAQLEEAQFAGERYHALESQYSSDLKRLEFIIDGKLKEKKIVPPSNCPYCGQALENVPSVEENYIETAEIEYNKIKLHLSDLQTVIRDNDTKIDKLKDQLYGLDEENGYIEYKINDELKLAAADLQKKIVLFQDVIDMQKELYAIDKMSAELNTDAYKKENEEDFSIRTYNGRDSLTPETWKELSTSLNQMIKECGYPGDPESRLNKDTADVIVGAKYKKNEGKGYRAYLNTIMLFNLMKYFERKAEYAPHLLILDSPILSLKEKKYDISEKEAATKGMRHSLFQYMVDNCWENQVIIVENEIPEDVDYKDSYIQEFSKDEKNGRCGFLESEH
ncbi:hypothetical protein CXIVA_18650 [Clostridium sp. SY8519]|uniref:hypothetical protein n=1 Tax=Clostridium sp. (strain SY8519) TaxID=1042156 RepID=UPI0002171F50|nr:hypothetical protein [Clostridium sp. SY8519]BAK47832.1 hypothetical protein CXIVA_18650 [Clostridium sp. SY8519]